MIKPLVLIPAAGFGVRMGEPPAKELLPLRIQSTHKILIEDPLRWCQQRQWPCLVISRKNKTSLNEYLQNNYPQVQLLQIESSKDWQDTLLQSQNLWLEKNIVLLPDVDFTPLEVLDQMAAEWKDQEAVAATHPVSDFQNWGFIYSQLQNEITVIEKPKTAPQSLQAWGVLGFKKEFGQKLLSAQIQSQRTGQEVHLQGSLSLFKLDSFKDLTRST